MLNQKTAIVTGASRGIGAAIAKRLASEGANVIVNYANSAKKADCVVAEIVAAKGQAIAIQADVSDQQQVNAMFEQAIQRYGQVDILVNNAALSLEKPFVDSTEQDLDRLFQTNIKGPFLTMQAAFKHLQTGGKIININSTVQDLLLPNYSVYAATKGAMYMLMRGLVKEAADRGLTINAVSPGATATEMLIHTTDEALRQTIAQQAALGRLGKPEDIANVVAFLAGPDANWLTGQDIRANGGWT